MIQTTVFTLEEEEIPLHYKPSRRAKRLSLRLSVKEGALILSMPVRTSQTQIKDFLNQCVPWVKTQLKKLEKKIVIEHGNEITLHGTVFQCVNDPLRRKPALCYATQTLHLPPRYGQKELYEVFKKSADKKLTPLVFKAAEILGQRVEKVTYKDTKTRWGSCSARKAIALNWRLVLAPPEVAHYVCVHEVAHLVHMNHSAAFWKVVSEFCPAYRTHRAWLKTNGPSLMRV